MLTRHARAYTIFILVEFIFFLCFHCSSLGIVKMNGVCVCVFYMISSFCPYNFLLSPVWFFFVFFSSSFFRSLDSFSILQLNCANRWIKKITIKKRRRRCEGMREQCINVYKVVLPCKSRNTRDWDNRTTTRIVEYKSKLSRVKVPTKKYYGKWE